MAENKKSFVLYADIIHMVRKMPKDKIADLFLTILAYVNDENPVIEDLLVDIAFEPIKLQLKRDLQKYEGIKDVKSLNGRVGNLKRYHLDIYNRFINDELTIDEAEKVAKSRKPSLSDISNYDTSQNIASVAVNDTVTENVTVINKEAKASMPSYSEIIKNKESICQHIRDYKPLSIDPYTDLWNIFATEKGLSTVQAINDSRRKKFKIRIREKPFDFLKILTKAKQSEFLKSSNWFSFDWIIENDTNYLKVLEGNYDSAKAEQNSTPGPSAAEIKSQRILNEVG